MFRPIDALNILYAQLKHDLFAIANFLLNNNDWWRYFVVKAQLYMVSQLDFINSILWMDDIQDVSTWTVNGKVDLLVPVGGGSCDRSPPQPGLLHLAMGLTCVTIVTACGMDLAISHEIFRLQSNQYYCKDQ